MTERLIVGIDSSTQSTKAVAWSRTGEALAEGRAGIPMQTPQESFCEQDPADWWRSTCEALQSLAKQIDTNLIDGMAISNQRETVGFFDENFEAVHPALVWLDGRSEAQAETIAQRVGADQVHEITGKPLDATPSHSSILWVMENSPQARKQVAHVLDVSSFLAVKLTGQKKVSWASADPSGLFDVKKRQWSKAMLEAVEARSSWFAEPVAPGALIGTLSPEAAVATGMPEGTRLFAGGGDGQCAGIGANAMRPGRVYLNLGTAIVTGVWAEGATISRAWRSMMSPTDDGYFLEGVMRAGTYFVDWLKQHYVDGSTPNADHAALQGQAAALPIGSDGLLVCPYLSGCMSPHWNGDARAAFFGISSIHTPVHLYRAAMEGLTGDIARTIADMRARGLDAREIVAVGGGANSSLWRKMVADSTGLPLIVSESLEASSLGAAIVAAVGAGWFDTFDEAADTMCRDGARYEPDHGSCKAWQRLLERQFAFNTYCCEHAELKQV